MNHTFESIYDQLADCIPSGTPENEIQALVGDFDAALRATAGDLLLQDGRSNPTAIAAAQELLDEVISALSDPGAAARKSPEHREQR